MCFCSDHATVLLYQASMIESRVSVDFLLPTYTVALLALCYCRHAYGVCIAHMNGLLDSSAFAYDCSYSYYTIMVTHRGVEPRLQG